MDSNGEKRMVDDYVIIHTFRIGDREIVLGENPLGVDGERYMCALCQSNGLMAGYTEVMVSDDYPELAKLFGERVAEQAEKTRIDLNGPKIQGIPNAPITADGCEVIGCQHNLQGKIVVIKQEVLRPEYRRATSQLYLCDVVSSSYAPGVLALPPTAGAPPVTARNCIPAKPLVLSGVTFSAP